MKNVKHLVANKGEEVWAIDAQQTVLEAITLMAEKKIGALVVLAGIFSERDYTRRVELHGKTSQQTKVSEIMSGNVITVGPDDTIEKCMALMTDHKIRHLPVLTHGKVTGILSIGDLVKAIIADQQETIEQLQGYITSYRQDQRRGLTIWSYLSALLPVCTAWAYFYGVTAPDGTLQTHDLQR